MATRLASILLGLALVALPPRAGLAAGESLLDRCWTPEALAASDKELKPSRSPVHVDVEALRKEPPQTATPVPPELRGSIRSVELPPGEKLIALTFDLCETNSAVAGYEGRIVDLLRAHGAKATFFASGKWLETHKERAEQLIADPNFELANHGFRHLDFSRIADRTLNDEVVLTEAAYMRARKALLARQCASGGEAEAYASPPERMSLIRFPFGTCNAKALAAVADAGLLAIQWDVVTGDPDPHKSAKAIANTILARVHPGAIVVAHANGRGRNTAAAFAIALPKLKEQGYSFVTVSELIKAGETRHRSALLSRPARRQSAHRPGKQEAQPCLAHSRPLISRAHG
jgi:peptidoglycan/xylan/chitin deacetylase (PgdA/CDA1 family)